MKDLDPVEVARSTHHTMLCREDQDIIYVRLGMIRALEWAMDKEVECDHCAVVYVRDIEKKLKELGGGK